MAKFKDLSKTNTGLSDRSAGDRYRHRQALRAAIRENLTEVINELDIFSFDKKSGKTFKIPVKFLEEFRFTYDPQKGNQSGGVGQKKNVTKGENVGESSSEKKSGEAKGSEEKAGKDKGELVLELLPEDIDFVLAQIAEDLNLPFLDPKKAPKVKVRKQSRWRGLKENGIEPRLDLEASFVKKIKRQKMLQKKGGHSSNTNPDKQFPFINDDLQYHGLGFKEDQQGNVLLIAIGDRSGSMKDEKIYWSKAFIYALYQLMKRKYKNTALVFISHDTEATETDSMTFFRIASGGGTSISSGPILATDIVKKKYSPEYWDIYTVHCSDGENDPNDDPKAIQAFKKLLPLCKLIGFIELKPGVSSMSTIGDQLRTGITSDRLRVLVINKKSEVGLKLREFLKKDPRLSVAFEEGMKNA